MKELSRMGSLSLLVPEVRQKGLLGVRPLLDLFFLALDAVGRGGFDGISGRHLHGRVQNLLQRKCPVLGQHDHQASGSTRGHSCQGTVGRRVLQLLLPEEIACSAGGSDAERIDADDLSGFRVIDKSLRLSAPAQSVEHGAGRGQHGAGRIYRVPALHEHHGPSGRC